MLFILRSSLLVVFCSVSLSPVAFADFVDDIAPPVTPSAQPKDSLPVAPPAEVSPALPPQEILKPAVPVSPPPSLPAPNHPTTPGLLGGDISHHDVSAPLTFKGDEYELTQKSGVMVLVGHVVLSQADTIAHADRAELYFEPNKKQPHRAMLKGNVKIEKRPSPQTLVLHAVSEEVEYFVAERKALLRGNPKIWRGEEHFQGHAMELNLETGVFKIKDVNAIVSPPPSGVTSADTSKKDTKRKHKP